MFFWVALAMIGSYSVVTIGDSEGTTWAAVILFFAFQVGAIVIECLEGRKEKNE